MRDVREKEVDDMLEATGRKFLNLFYYKPTLSVHSWWCMYNIFYHIGLRPTWLSVDPFTSDVTCARRGKGDVVR